MMRRRSSASVPAGFVRTRLAGRPAGGARRFFKAASIFSAVLATATVIAVSGASAASAKCQPHRSDNGVYQWDGWYKDYIGGGVYSDILNYSPWVQPSTPGVVAWSMLTVVGAEGTYWAQVGWQEAPYGVRHTFVQWTTSAHNWQTKFFVAKPAGTYTYYTVLWNNKPGYFSFQLNSTTIDTEVARFTPNEGQIFGETTTLADQMPGGYDSHEDFRDSHVYISGWENFGGSAGAYDGNYYGNSINSSTDDQIWDWSCLN